MLFAVGAVVNVLQVVRAPDRNILQLMNLTAITFVTGSMLFAVASIPYLFDLQSSADERTIDAFLASQYVLGSVLFLLGGWFNYRRARIIASSEDDGGSSRPSPPTTPLLQGPDGQPVTRSPSCRARRAMAVVLFRRMYARASGEVSRSIIGVTIHRYSNSIRVLPSLSDERV